MKSFLSGYTAKMAMVAVALSSVVMTGCYKDDGLDVNKPVVDIPLPDATYMLNVSVVDETGAPVPPSANATITVGSSTYEGTTASVSVTPPSVQISASATGYASASKTVTIAALEAGQSATYTEVLVLTKNVEQTYPVTYNLDVTVLDSEGVAVPADAYTINVAGAGSLTGLSSGMYSLVVTPTAEYANVYQAATVYVLLPAVTSTTENDVRDYPVYVTMNKIAAETEYVILSGSVSNLPADFEAVSMTLYKDGVAVASGVTSVQYIAEKDDAQYELVFIYNDAEGNKVEVRKGLNGVQTSWSFVFDEDGNTQTAVSVPVVDGEVAEEINKSVGQGDALLVEAGTQVMTEAGEPFNGTFDVVRETSEETSSEIRVYTGTPNGLTFEPAFQLSFADNWGTELGSFDLQYLNGLDWESEDEVLTDGTKYVMNIAHFSSFRSQLVADVAAVAEVDSTSTITTVDRKNDTDMPISVHFDYTYRTGIVVDDVTTAVRNAGFTNENAIAYVANLINAELASRNLVAQDVTIVNASKEFTVGAYTVLNSVKKTQYTTTTTLTFTVNGKSVVVSATSYDRAEITPDMYTYGHGHGHSHGHGGDLNAGGGIVEAE